MFKESIVIAVIFLITTILCVPSLLGTFYFVSITDKVFLKTILIIIGLLLSIGGYFLAMYVGDLICKYGNVDVTWIKFIIWFRR